jgi:hypothetical protein
MTRRLLIYLAFTQSFANTAVAQPASGSAEQYDACFRAARAADAFCMKADKDAATRLTCLQDARTAQLECLERLANTAPPDTERPSQRPDSAPTGALIAPVPPAPAAKPPDPPKQWVISETQSPIDYSPIITASIALDNNDGKRGSRLAIHCRSGRTEWSLATVPPLSGSPGREMSIDIKIADRATVRTNWSLSANATAVLKDPAPDVLGPGLFPDEGLLTIIPVTSAATAVLIRFSEFNQVRKRLLGVCGAQSQGPSAGQIRR